MTGYTLRDYQEAGNNAIRDLYRQGKRRALLVMPTGAGKTLTGADMLAGTNRKGKRVLWVTDRQELAEQAGEAFDLAGVPFSWITADQEPEKWGSAWVGTIQAFLARQKAGKWLPPYVDLVVVDEAHRAESASYQALYAEYPSAYSVGLTATPMRGDGRGLGNTYDGMVTPITTGELIARGFLVPPRYFIPSQIDTSSVQKPGGDYSRDDLEQIAQANPQLIGDVVENFARICPQRRAVAFPMTIQHSLALRDAFNAAGIPACHIDGQTHKGTRRELMRAFKAGEYQVLTSVNIAIEGLDVPDVSAVIMARPTKSERIWVQAVGRGLRASPGKRDAFILDHSGCLAIHGPAEEFEPPALHARKGRSTRGSGGSRKKKHTCTSCKTVFRGGKACPKCDEPVAEPVKREISCEECSAVFYGSRVCPICGHEHERERAPRDVTYAEAELIELTQQGKADAEADLRRRRQWWQELQGYARNKGYAPGWAFHKFKEKFGAAPSWELPPAAPGPEVLRWVKARQIAYWKAKESHVGHAAD